MVSSGQNYLWPTWRVLRCAWDVVDVGKRGKLDLERAQGNRGSRQRDARHDVQGDLGKGSKELKYALSFHFPFIDAKICAIGGFS